MMMMMMVISVNQQNVASGPLCSPSHPDSLLRSLNRKRRQGEKREKEVARSRRNSPSQLTSFSLGAVKSLTLTANFLRTNKNMF